jgi:hypothetical protein
LKYRNNKRGFASVALALGFCLSAYLVFSTMASLTYDSIHPNIFENIKEDKGALSVVLRCLFLFIFLCNIPFVFYAGRECFIVLVLEFNERRVSNKLIKEIAQRREVIQSLIDEEFSKVQTTKNQEIEKPASNLIFYSVVFGLFTT